MKVLIDLETCLGCGVCESIAPDIFVLGDEIYAKVKIDPIPEHLKELVENAILECPEEAISITQDEILSEL